MCWRNNIIFLIDDGTIRWKNGRRYGVEELRPLSFQLENTALQTAQTLANARGCANVRILDLGGATGALADEFKKCGFDVDLVDGGDFQAAIDHRNAQYHSSSGKIRFFQKDILDFLRDNKGEKYDIIICSNVLHFFDEKGVAQIFRGAADLLKEDGLFFTRTLGKTKPSISDWFWREGNVKFRKPRWWNLLRIGQVNVPYCAHLSENIKQVANTAGLTALKTYLEPAPLSRTSGRLCSVFKKTPTPN